MFLLRLRRACPGGTTTDGLERLDRDKPNGTKLDIDLKEPSLA
jgi:hypothetical protein